MKYEQNGSFPFCKILTVLSMIYKLLTGIDSIAADLKEQKMTVIGEMDTVAIAKKLKKIGKIDILSVGPAKEEKKDDKKDDKKGDKK